MNISGGQKKPESSVNVNHKFYFKKRDGNSNTTGPDCKFKELMGNYGSKINMQLDTLNQDISCVKRKNL